MTRASVRFAGMVGLAIASLAFGQRTGGYGGVTPFPPTSESGDPADTASIDPPASSSKQSNVRELSRPVFVTGAVIVADGSELPSHVLIERVCGGQVRAEGYTNSKGRFSLQLGVSQAAFADASTGAFSSDDFGPGAGLGEADAGQGTMGVSSIESQLWNCELRAKLAGYRSGATSLSGRRHMDDPEVGYIVLYPMNTAAGTMESATAALAPKDARKAYEKGLEAVHKRKPEQAEKELRKAVGLYARHASAWLELGKLAESRKDFEQARRDYEAAIAADAKFVYPYVQLYQLDLAAQDWEALAQRTDALLRLNPYEFPDAFYLNSLALFQLKRYPEAEQSARQAIQADFKHALLKAHYLLGMVLYREKRYEDAVNSLRTYLQLAPPADSSVEQARDLIAWIQGTIAAGPFTRP